MIKLKVEHIRQAKKCKIIFYSLVMNVLALNSFSQAYLDISKNAINDGQLIDSVGNLNYLNPVLNYYINRDSTLESYGVYNQSFSFAGNYYFTYQQSKIRTNKQDYNQISAYLKRDAIKRIVDLAKKTNVVMINEQHDWPIDRAFCNIVITELRKIGYNTLALETFSNTADSFKYLNSTIGYFSNEPFMGELIRNAYKLGYKFLSYDVTNLPANIEVIDANNYRDSVAASILARKIVKSGNAKTIVLCGYSHNSEKPIKNDVTYFPLAYWLKKDLNIDPLTIDQVFFSAINPSGWYDAIKNAIPIKTTLYIEKGVVGVSNDIYIIHPATNFVNERPDWGLKYFDKQPIEIEIPVKFGKVAIVQAYYQNELDKDAIDKLVPADQFFLQKNRKILCLYLKPNYKYLVVYRDIRNKILAVQPLEI